MQVFRPLHPLAESQSGPISFFPVLAPQQAREAVLYMASGETREKIVAVFEKLFNDSTPQEPMENDVCCLFTAIMVPSEEQPSVEKPYLLMDVGAVNRGLREQVRREYVMFELMPDAPFIVDVHFSPMDIFDMRGFKPEHLENFVRECGGDRFM